MATECRQDSFNFGTAAGRAVVGGFGGGGLVGEGLHGGQPSMSRRSDANATRNLLGGFAP